MSIRAMDSRHADLITEQLGLSNSSKGVSTPGEPRGDYHNIEELSPDLVTTYRSCAMKLAYLAADLLTSWLGGMSKPTVGHWNRLKRDARYVKQHARWCQTFEMQMPVRSIDAYTDSDWTGDALDRKSVSCAVIMMGKHLIKFSVATQSTPALTSGEAEYLATLRGPCCIQGNSITDWIGQVRHLDRTWLGLQPHVGKQRISMITVAGGSNVANLGIKDLDAQKMSLCMRGVGFVELSGKHRKALAAK
eukprot:1340327-Amphidinium_carterae.1